MASRDGHDSWGFGIYPVAIMLVRSGIPYLTLKVVAHHTPAAESRGMQAASQDSLNTYDELAASLRLTRERSFLGV